MSRRQKLQTIKLQTTNFSRPKDIRKKAAFYCSEGLTGLKDSLHSPSTRCTTLLSGIQGDDSLLFYLTISLREATY